MGRYSTEKTSKRTWGADPVLFFVKFYSWGIARYADGTPNRNRFVRDRVKQKFPWIEDRWESVVGSPITEQQWNDGVQTTKVRYRDWPYSNNSCGALALGLEKAFSHDGPLTIDEVQALIVESRNSPRGEKRPEVHPPGGIYLHRLQCGLIKVGMSGDCVKRTKAQVDLGILETRILALDCSDTLLRAIEASTLAELERQGHKADHKNEYVTCTMDVAADAVKWAATREGRHDAYWLD